MSPVSSAVRAVHGAVYCLSIERSGFIRGFRRACTEVEVLAYADIAVFCSDVDIISGAVRLTKVFCEPPGAAVNWEESCGFFGE